MGESWVLWAEVFAKSGESHGRQWFLYLKSVNPNQTTPFYLPIGKGYTDHRADLQSMRNHGHESRKNENTGRYALRMSDQRHKMSCL
jgi:hypothetical protein